MQFEQADDSGSATILASNKSYRPTNGAIIHSEDTEFNDALRARGIIPQKQVERSVSPEPLLERDAIESADLDDDDDLLGLEDDIPSAVLDKYREARLAEVAKLQKTRRFGSVLPIGREEYTRDVTDASKDDIKTGDDERDEEEFRGKGTGVVCFLWKDSVPESQLLGQHLAKLASAYPSTKFVSIRGDMCIADYPDKNIPTMLIYRRGALIKNVIGLGKANGLKGMQTTVHEVEALLTICDAVDPFLKVAPTGPDGSHHGGQRGDSEDEDDEEASRRTRRGKIQRADLGSYGDDELDL